MVQPEHFFALIVNVPHVQHFFFLNAMQWALTRWPKAKGIGDKQGNLSSSIWEKMHIFNLQPLCLTSLVYFKKKPLSVKPEKKEAMSGSWSHTRGSKLLCLNIAVASSSLIKLLISSNTSEPTTRDVMVCFFQKDAVRNRSNPWWSENGNILESSKNTCF